MTMQRRKWYTHSSLSLPVCTHPQDSALSTGWPEGPMCTVQVFLILQRFLQVAVTKAVTISEYGDIRHILLTNITISIFDPGWPRAPYMAMTETSKTDIMLMQNSIYGYRQLTSSQWQAFSRLTSWWQAFSLPYIEWLLRLRRSTQYFLCSSR